MYPHFIRTAVALLALLACSAAHATIPTFEGYAAASDEELDKMRGGFELNLNGMKLMLAFSLEQLTYINGKLVSSMKFNPLQLIAANSAPGTTVADTPQPTNPASSTINPTQTALTDSAQSGTTPTTGAATGTETGMTTGVTTGVTTGMTTGTETGTTTGATTGTTTGATAGTTAQLVNNQGVITLVQNGTGNVFTLPASLSSLGTVIQNTVNDQVIRNLTVLNATLSIRAAAAAMQLGAALNQAIAASVR